MLQVLVEEVMVEGINTLKQSHFSPIGNKGYRIWTYQKKAILPFLGNKFQSSWKYVSDSMSDVIRLYINYVRMVTGYNYASPPIWGWIFKSNKIQYDITESLWAMRALDDDLILLELVIPHEYLIVSDFDKWCRIVCSEDINPSFFGEGLFSIANQCHAQVTFPFIEPNWICSISDVICDSSGYVIEYKRRN